MKIIQKIDFNGDKADAILAVMRSKMPGEPSWSAVRKLLRGRKVAIGGVICLDEGRRITPGETLTVYDQPLPPPPDDKDVKICHVDARRRRHHRGRKTFWYAHIASAHGFELDVGSEKSPSNAR